MIKKYQGFSFFIIDLALIVFTLVGPFLLYFLNDKLFHWGAILCCWSFSVIFYLLGANTWWNVYLFSDRVVLKNNWLIFWTCKIEYAYDHIEYINVEFLNWSGKTYRKRPIITIKSERTSKRFIGIDRSETEDFITQMSSLNIRVINDLK